MPGITIGEGAIIASNSIVTEDVEPYSIIAGSPARLVKKRFDDSVIQRILNLDIYSWDKEKFNCLKKYICNNDIDILEEQSRKYDARNPKN
ncbi:chloramphenicol acetyltransferase [Legionella drozanskii LLAP-1]|uniref:Chloramphenicol acetyltransferase n=1 Tax=Legionella drozanskii LLAP-1 TaxID=1212489 RepID=A0A0W0SMC1_9GAMM|nr:chloramphenicol acetyltransferase [Legionella drozanskii]KTC84527.1 chloramphenicol acetyltransferase [Legionella drozanskii LLAP-1]